MYLHQHASKRGQIQDVSALFQKPPSGCKRHANKLAVNRVAGNMVGGGGQHALRQLLRNNRLHLARLRDVLFKSFRLSNLALARLPVRDLQELVHGAHVDGELQIKVRVCDISQQEEKIEAGQERHRQIDIFGDCFLDVVSTVMRVGRCKHL
jgi:hypothetical protein